MQGAIGEIHAGPVVTLYELEPAPGIRSARVIGVADEIKGHVVECFVVLRNAQSHASDEAHAQLRREIEDVVVRRVGALARPAFIGIVQSLPKTRSGKVVRRAILAVAEGRATGDISTMEDVSALEGIRREVATAHPEATVEGTSVDV